MKDCMMTEDDYARIGAKIMNEIDNASAGPELDLLIEVEIFGALPLTEDEWNLCKAMIEYRDPNMGIPDMRMIKMPVSELTYSMKLPFRLIWPRWFSREGYGNYLQMLVEKMRLDGWLFELCDYDTTTGEDLRSASFQKGVVKGESWANNDALAIARAALSLLTKFWTWRKFVPIEPETPCKGCGHEAHHHDAVVRRGKPDQYIIRGCGVIEIDRKPHDPWTWESLFAGQHKPCRCKWNGKSRQ